MSNTDTEILRFRSQNAIIREDYQDISGAKARIISGLIHGSLEYDRSFLAYCQLQTIGPKNDWNGLRSAAQHAISEWEEKVLNPAVQAYGSLKTPDQYLRPRPRACTPEEIDISNVETIIDPVNKPRPYRPEALDFEEINDCSITHEENGK